MGWVLAGLGIVLAALAVWWARIAFRPPSRLRPGFIATNDQGAFGELLTAAYLTAHGWRQLPSKLGGGGAGIDGLFVRQGIFGRRILIVETKTNASRYKPRQLANATLIATLGELYLIGSLPHDAAQEIIDALKRRSPAVRKECWRHDLTTGQTHIRAARSDGMRHRRVRSVDHTALMESLTMMLAALDRNGEYIRVR
jgi:hypothetical protein